MSIKRTLATASVLAMAIIGLAAAPAHAAGQMTHLPDDGYNRAFLVTCSGGGTQNVYEGQSSTCPSGTVAVYVYDGQEIWCRYTSYSGQHIWYKAADATGSYNTANFISLQCVSQAD